jgi:hypothetical protein
LVLELFAAGQAEGAGVAQVRDPDAVVGDGLNQDLLPRDIRLISASDDQAPSVRFVLFGEQLILSFALTAKLEYSVKIQRMDELPVLIDLDLVGSIHRRLRSQSDRSLFSSGAIPVVCDIYLGDIVSWSARGLALASDMQFSVSVLARACQVD